MTFRFFGVVLAALACAAPAPSDIAAAQSRATGLEHRDAGDSGQDGSARRHRHPPRRERHQAGAQKTPSSRNETPTVPENAQTTPRSVPVPPPNPGGITRETGEPALKTGAGKAPAQAALPGEIPIPAPKPERRRPAEEAGADAPGKAQKAPPPAPSPLAPSPLAPPPSSLPPDEIACRSRLTSLGAAFTEQPPQSDPAGCSIPHPVLLSRLSGSITLEPAALVNCAVAEAAARFTQGVITPLAREHMGRELVSIGDASGYACRPRHGTARLSEHAFGNALDMGRFVFSGGVAIGVGPVPGAGAAFLGAVRKAACGPFKTVLGPGSDADHARHLHLDLQRRRGGGTFCQ